MKQLTKQILQVLTKRERRRLFLISLCSILISLVDIASLAYLLVVVNIYAGSIRYEVRGLLPRIFVDAGTLWPVTVLLGLFCIKNTAGFFLHRAQYGHVYHVASRISSMNMLRYFEGSYRDHVNTDSAVWIRRISQQPVEFGHYVLSGLQQVITETVLIIFAIAAIIWFNAKLFFLLLLVLLPAVFLVTWFTRRRLRTVRLHVKTAGDTTLQYLKEGLQGYVESNTYQRNRFFTDRYAGYQDRLNGYLAELQVIQGAPSRLMELFAVMGLFTLVLLTRIQTGVLQANVITIGAFMAAAYKIIPGMVRILNATAQIKTYAFTLNDLVQPVHREEEMTKRDGIEPLRSVSIEALCFSHEGKKIIQHFSMDMQAGELIGITGGSGKGKTTLINLLLGFLDADSGNIAFNHRITVPEKRRANWSQVAYVKQQPFLLHDTIRTNICLSQTTEDPERLQNIINITGLDRLGEGAKVLDKLVAENGKNISGGQRQRIALARALYKKANLLILDEPFSELDETATALLLTHLKEEAATGKIILLVTHDSRSQDWCDKIISLHEVPA